MTVFEDRERGGGGISYATHMYKGEEGDEDERARTTTPQSTYAFQPLTM